MKYALLLAAADPAASQWWSKEVLRRCPEWDDAIVSTPGEAEKFLLSEAGRTLAVLVVATKADMTLPQTVRRLMLLVAASDIPCVAVSAEVSEVEASELNFAAILPADSRGPEVLAAIRAAAKGRLEQLEFEVENRRVYLEECEELVAEIEPALLRLEETPDSLELVHHIFRAVHTIKGGSGCLGLGRFTAFLHTFEELLNELRSQKMPVTPGVIDQLLAGVDQIRRVLAAPEAAHEFIELDVAAGASSPRAGARPRAQAPVRGELSAGPPRSPPATLESQGAESRKESLTVPVSLLNQLMAYCGELTVYRNMLAKLVTAVHSKLPGDPDVLLLESLFVEMSGIQNEIQTDISEIRKLPLSAIFTPLQRIVRDLGRSLGHSARLEWEGASLRVDTTLAQVFSASLVHLIRNSMDHAIETPQERAQAGKPVCGLISIRARDSGECIIMEVEDDGRGLNLARISEKAVERGLVTHDQLQEMPPQAIYRLILSPGFSTASQVTEISGRGVGMDMVAATIQGLRGKIEIDSEAGQGSLITLTVPKPKSVEILDGLVVVCHGQRFAIPLHAVDHLLSRKHGDKTSVTKVQGGEVVRHGKAYVPLLPLHEALHLAGDGKTGDAGDDIVVCRLDGTVFALGVEEIVDSESIVVKPLLPLIARQRLFEGAAIMGDGSVGLILSVDNIGRSTRGVGAGDVVAQVPPSTKRSGAQLVGPHGLQQLEVRLSVPGTFALPLTAVARLEQLSRSQLESTADGLALIAHGCVVPVRHLLDPAPLHELPEGEISIVVLEHDGASVGAVVEKIVDVLPGSDSELMPPPKNFPCAAGVYLRGKTPVTLLDVDRLRALHDLQDQVVAPPAEKLTTNGEEPDTTETQPQPSWGMF